MQTSFAPQYLYVQYADDPYLQALVSAFNQYAQAYLNAFNALNLPVYTQLSGPLLDWVGVQLYGILRPVFSMQSGTFDLDGNLNATDLNTADLNAGPVRFDYTHDTATDDQYQRVMTWNLYKGDGYQFTGRWLKRRVLRFLTGTNGVDPGITETYLISVTYDAGNQIVIGCDSSLPNISLLQQAMQGGFLNVPFQYNFSVIST